MQFKRVFVLPILKGYKTQTRRLGEKKYKEGQLVKAQCGYREKAFATLRITRVFKQCLRDMSMNDVLAEGFHSWSDYMLFLEYINHKDISIDIPVTVIEFIRLEGK